MTANDFLASLKTVTVPLDSFLRDLADPVIDWAHAEQEKAASENAEYADIAARRTAANADMPEGTSVLTDENYGLDLDDWFRQMEIEAEHTQWNGILTVARFLSSRPFTRATSNLLSTVQLMTRGWADEDTWGLNDVLAARLGAQLIHLADNSVSWPGNDEFPEPHGWETALRFNGERLLAYRTRWDLDTSLPYEERIQEENRITEEAQDALRWVADHLSSLWD